MSTTSEDTPKKLGRSKKERSDPLRFNSPGINYKGKLIGVEDVPSPRGDKMCQVAMAKVKAAIKTMGDHKQKIVINVSTDGVKITDEKTEDLIYFHPVQRISFIARDPGDSRAFGYVYGSGEGKHQFYGIKTEKVAEGIVLCFRDLFEFMFEKKKREMEEAKLDGSNDKNSETHSETRPHPDEHLFMDVDNMFDEQFSEHSPEGSTYSSSSSNSWRKMDRWTSLNSTPQLHSNLPGDRYGTLPLHPRHQASDSRRSPLETTKKYIQKQLASSPFALRQSSMPTPAGSPFFSSKSHNPPMHGRFLSASQAGLHESSHSEEGWAVFDASPGQGPGMSCESIQEAVDGQCASNAASNSECNAESASSKQAKIEGQAENFNSNAGSSLLPVAAQSKVNPNSYTLPLKPKLASPEMFTDEESSISPSSASVAFPSPDAPPPPLPQNAVFDLSMHQSPPPPPPRPSATQLRLPHSNPSSVSDETAIYCNLPFSDQSGTSFNTSSESQQVPKTEFAAGFTFYNLPEDLSSPPPPPPRTLPVDPSCKGAISSFPTDKNDPFAICLPSKNLKSFISRSAGGEPTVHTTISPLPRPRPRQQSGSISSSERSRQHRAASKSESSYSNISPSNFSPPADAKLEFSKLKAESLEPQCPKFSDSPSGFESQNSNKINPIDDPFVNVDPFAVEGSSMDLFSGQPDPLLTTSPSSDPFSEEFPRVSHSFLTRAITIDVQDNKITNSVEELSEDTIFGPSKLADQTNLLHESFNSVKTSASTAAYFPENSNNFQVDGQPRQEFCPSQNSTLSSVANSSTLKSKFEMNKQSSFDCLLDNFSQRFPAFDNESDETSWTVFPSNHSANNLPTTTNVNTTNLQHLTDSKIPSEEPTQMSLMPNWILNYTRATSAFHESRMNLQKSLDFSGDR